MSLNFKNDQILFPILRVRQYSDEHLMMKMVVVYPRNVLNKWWDIPGTQIDPSNWKESRGEIHMIKNITPCLFPKISTSTLHFWPKYSINWFIVIFCIEVPHGKLVLFTTYKDQLKNFTHYFPFLRYIAQFGDSWRYVKIIMSPYLHYLFSDRDCTYQNSDVNVAY